ncbi:MAG: N-acetyltransferase family protein [Pseudomonadota bacterium]
MRLRPPRPSDAMEISAIHAEGLATGHASFRDMPVDGAEVVAAPLALVAERDGIVLGWASLTRASERAVYRGVGEVSLYVAAQARGQRLGAALMSGMIERSESDGWWTLWSHIFPENLPSIRLHERHGFQRIGLRQGMGRMTYGPMAGAWRDNLLMERRSDVVGC